jgi:hypothetical protein
MTFYGQILYPALLGNNWIYEMYYNNNKNLMLLNYAPSMDPYIVLIIVCYNKLKDMVCFFLFR